MGMVVEQCGIPYEILNQDSPPEYLEFLAGIDKVRSDSTIDTDLAIVLDLDSLDRLGSVREAIEACDRMILIDHHQPVHEPGDIRIVDTNAPATASIICDLIFRSEIEVTQEMADCLLAGILTDTGSLRYPNTTPHCLDQTARLVELGASLPRITEEVYMTKPLAAVRLLGAAIEAMRLECHDKLAWVILPHDLYERIGATEQHTEGIVNELLAVRTVKVAAVIRESKPGRFKASLRSRGKIDVAEVAQSLGGGGHKNAAGVTFEGTAEGAEQAIIGALRECLESC